MAGSRPRRCKRNPAWNQEQGRQHVKAQVESGLSIQDYCFAHGLKVHTFHNWRRRLKREMPCPDGWAEESRIPGGPAFAEVFVASRDLRENTPIVEVVLHGGRRLRVEPDFDEDALRRLVALLESLPC